jgi:prepilin-type N-terminal cleavage/methylation domain-containing protein
MLTAGRAGRDPGTGDEAGFTLVELLVTALVAVIVLAIAGGALESMTTASNRATSAATSMSAVSRAVGRLSADLRSTHALTVASSTSFTATVNQPDGTTATVVWSIAGGDLTRTVGGGSPATFLTGLASGSGFAYFTPSGTAAAPSCTSRVVVDLIEPTGQTAVTPYQERVSIAVTDQAMNIAEGNVSC